MTPDKNVSLIVGVLSLLLVIYRILVFMVPMMRIAIDERNIYKALESLIMLV